jgi:PDZ domain
MNYEEPKTETETLSADEQKIREMCLSLKRIDAPKDFDFKLKARIADCQPGDFQPRFGFAFRYAWPALAVIFVLSFLAYTSGVFSSSNNNPVIAESSVQQNPSLPQNTMVANYTSPIPKEQPDENLTASKLNQETPKTFEKQQVVENNPQNPKKVFDNRKKDSFKGSKDSALKVDKPIQPNFNSNSIPQNAEKVTLFSVKEILEQLGISAVFENGKWVVKSVVQNGVAKSSGIKENDVIEAIDNQKVSNEPVSSKTLNFKNITVTRNGEKMEIKLRNKQ